MTTKRKPKEVELTPEYEDKVPVANKITLNPRHPELERTILLKEPRGRKAREMTVRLMPFMAHFDNFMGNDGEVNLEGMGSKFSEIISQLWGQADFEDELLPFAIGLDPKVKKDAETLDSLTLMGAFEAFMKAFNFLMSGASDEEFIDAEKKSEADEEAEAEQA